MGEHEELMQNLIFLMIISFDKMGIALGLGSNSAAKVIPYLFELNYELGLPTRLRDIGVKEFHIEKLSKLAKEDFCHPSNPKPVGKTNFEAIYRLSLIHI